MPRLHRRKVLFVGVHARRIAGWPAAESRMFLQDLLEHATRRELRRTTINDTPEAMLPAA